VAGTAADAAGGTVAEDDSHNGVDHVDGRGGPLLIVSPYAKRGIVDDSCYTQLNIVRTIEQIPGMPAMNQEDRAAVPMAGAFTDTPDFAPYDVVPDKIPLTLGLTPAPSASASASVSASPSVSASNASHPARTCPRTTWATEPPRRGPRRGGSTGRARRRSGAPRRRAGAGAG